MIDQSRSVIDPRRSSCLRDVGASDYLAAVCVNPEGCDELWLISRTQLATEHPECGDPVQPHETIGRLPVRIRDRIWGDDLRCGWPRRNGRPCRHRVKSPGDVCNGHAAQRNRAAAQAGEIR